MSGDSSALTTIRYKIAADPDFRWSSRRSNLVPRRQQHITYGSAGVIEKQFRHRLLMADR
jgi:hypothetical protein